MLDIGYSIFPYFRFPFPTGEPPVLLEFPFFFIVAALLRGAFFPILHGESIAVATTTPLFLSRRRILTSAVRRPHL